jgi:hypothetical protein
VGQGVDSGVVKRGGEGVLGGVRVHVRAFKVYFVSETAQVELES